MVKQFVLFSTVGAVGTVAHFVTLFVLVHFGATTPVPGSMAGFAVGAMVNYRLNYFITFKSQNSHGTTFLKFISVAFTGLIINTFIMNVATEYLNYLVSQAMATSFVLIWNFLFNRFWTFKEMPCVR